MHVLLENNNKKNNSRLWKECIPIQSCKENDKANVLARIGNNWGGDDSEELCAPTRIIQKKYNFVFVS